MEEPQTEVCVCVLYMSLWVTFFLILIEVTHFVFSLQRSEVVDLTVQPESEGETKTWPKSDDLSLTDLGNNHHRGREVDVCVLMDDPVRVGGQMSGASLTFS